MADFDNPYWYKLIESWCHEDKTGLSIPFISGAQTIVNENVKITAQNTTDFLNELFAFASPKRVIRIKWCREVHTYVIGLCDEEDLGSGLMFGGVHAAADVIEEFGETIPDIIAGITAMFSKEINAGMFSKFGREWQPYTKADKAFIIQSLSY
jgi:hypothetical protein